MDIAALIQQCAPAVDSSTALALIWTESRNRPLAIGVNAKGSASQYPKSAAHAAQIAREYIARGLSIDLGLAQINSKNLPMLKMSVEQAFDPCSNLKAMEYILGDCYRRTATVSGNRVYNAMSCYNTGNFINGHSNGYVQRFLNAYKLQRTNSQPSIYSQPSISNVNIQAGNYLALNAPPPPQARIPSVVDFMPEKDGQELQTRQQSRIDPSTVDIFGTGISNDAFR